MNEFHGKPWIRATRGYRHRISLQFGIQATDGSWTMAQPLTMLCDSTDDGTREPVPFMDLDTTTAQALMDELWQCGLRPTEGTGSAGAMAAVQAHLADLQKLVFKPRIDPELDKRAGAAMTRLGID